MGEIRKRIIRVYYGDGRVGYKCQRTGFFRKNKWRDMCFYDGEFV